MDPSFEINLSNGNDAVGIKFLEKNDFKTRLNAVLSQARQSPSFRKSKGEYEFRAFQLPSVGESRGASHIGTLYRVVLRRRTMGDRIKSGLRRIFFLGEDRRKATRDAARSLGLQLVRNAVDLDAHRSVGSLRKQANDLYRDVESKFRDDTSRIEPKKVSVFKSHRLLKEKKYHEFSNEAIEKCLERRRMETMTPGTPGIPGIAKSKSLLSTIEEEPGAEDVEDIM